MGASPDASGERAKVTKKREAVLASATAVVVVLALLTVLAIELSGTFAKSRSDIERTFRERAQLTAALTSSIFASAVSSSTQQTTSQYGGDLRQVRASMAQAIRQQHLAFIAVLDSRGSMLAASPQLPAKARAQIPTVPRSEEKDLRSGYSLSDILPYGSGGSPVVEFAQPVRARDGSRRIIVSGFAPKLLESFIAGYLGPASKIRGGTAYVADSAGAAVGGASSKLRAGAPLPEQGLDNALNSREQGPYDGNRWFTSARVAGSSWRVVLTAPAGELFASVTGARKLLPWVLFAGFGLAAFVVLLLGRRVLRAAAQVRQTNIALELANAELAVANEKLERRAAELARSNAELDQFASIASHDLQEPLRKVRTFTERLSSVDAAALSEQGSDYLRRANAAAERMQRLIDDLLRYSRVSTHGRAFAPVDLQAVAREVIADLDHQVSETGARVEVGVLPPIRGDAFQLRQLLQNLLSNAIKFRRQDVPPVVSIDGRLENGIATVTVADNGIGFDPEYSSRIFRVFERLHGRAEYPGTGIGLALCRKIAERHGGTIVAESAVGQGSRFTVTLDGRLDCEVVIATPLHHNGTEHEHDPEETYVAS
jgi:signal transduction histidine kinase